jgi:hypothetical protein
MIAWSNLLTVSKHFAQHLRRNRDIAYETVQHHLADPRVLELSLSGIKFA